MGKFQIWGRLEVGWEKVACWSTKAAISLKRVKIEEKLLWRAYRKSQMLFRTVPSPTRYGLPFPRLRVRNPTPKLQSLLSQEWLKLYGLQISPIHSQGPSEHKPMKNFGEKGAWAYPGTAQIFSVPPIISITGKATNFEFCTHNLSIDRNKSPLQISGKVAVC